MRDRLKKLRRRITHSDWFVGVLALLSTWIIRIYARTLRIQWQIDPEFEKCDSSKVLFGFWHGRQFLLVPTCGSFRPAVMTDISWAGSIQARILQRFGYSVVRGSSKRKGAQAVRDIRERVESGVPGAFALDGPKGPIYRSKPGIQFLSNKLDYPVVPVATSARRAWLLKSTWCRYMLPRPFTECVIMVGKPMQPPVELNQLDEAMMATLSSADTLVGRTPESEPTLRPRNVSSGSSGIHHRHQSRSRGR